MKKSMFALLLLPVLLTGCATRERLDNVQSKTQRLMDDAMESGAMNTTVTLISGAEAEEIALNHAGLTKDQVTWLRAEYEIDNGRPQYEVEFHYEQWEYDYEIDAETGEILGWDKEL